MKRLISVFLLVCFMLGVLGQGGQDSTRYVWNAITGNWDYISQVNPVKDSIINFGTNNTVSEDTLNGAIGHGNSVTADNSLAFGYMNSTARPYNLLFGAYLASDTIHTITIGRGLSMANRMVNSLYGSIGLGFFATEPVMYIQSGYEYGETHVADIGGISIGGPELDTLTALQINKHLVGQAYFLKCKNYDGSNVFAVDYDGNANLIGSLEVDSVICVYVPTIHQAAGDTSNYQVPDKIGDMFIDTSAGETYISVGTSRGDWEKLNMVWPVFLLAMIRRRRWL